MSRVYQRQSKSLTPKPWPWEDIKLSDLPVKGPGSVIAPGYPGGRWLKLRTYARQMKPGEILYLGLHARLRVIER